MKTKSLLLSIFLFVFIWSCSGTDEETAQTPVIPVKTEKAKMEKISRPVHTSGILTPVSQIKLSFKIGGIIKKWYIDEGSKVKNGQLLAELDQSEINARVNQAESAFEKARRDFARIKSLYQDSVATIEQMQNAETGLQVAEADLKIAKFNLKHSAIYAPADGSILVRMAENDELVAAGQPVYLFGVSGNEWIVRVGVSEPDLLRLAIDDPADVRFDAYPGKVFQARITEIAETASPMNGTFEIELAMQKNKEVFKSGFIAKVEVHPVKTEEFYTIPIEALVEADEAGGYVYVPAGETNTVKKVPVDVKFVQDNRVAIFNPNGALDLVVTDGSNYLNESSTIKITN
jgi:multidrug efflux system membrane fusion protein